MGAEPAGREPCLPAAALEVSICSVTTFENINLLISAQPIAHVRQKTALYSTSLIQSPARGLPLG